MSIAVLLVDDAQDVRRMVRTALRLRGGFEVVGEASSGAEAVRLADVLHPDIVVLDLGLPDIAGREVLTRIRGQSPGSRVVVFTGMDPPTGEGSPGRSRATSARTPSCTTWWTSSRRSVSRLPPRPRSTSPTS